VGVFTLAREFVTGVAYRAASATNVTTETATAWQLQEPIGATGASVWSSITSALPRGGTLAALWRTLASRSTAAAERRANMARLWQYVNHTALRAWAEVRAETMASNATSPPPAYSQAPFIKQDTIDCLSPWDELCDDCLFLDNLIGTLIRSVVQMAAFFAGDASAEPSFNHSRTLYNAYNLYLADASPTVEIGDDPSNPVRWPWNDRSNWRILGDRTTNKLRFSDLADRWDGLWSELSGAWEDQTGLSLTASAAAEGPTLNGLFAGTLGDAARAIRGPAPSHKRGLGTTLRRSTSRAGAAGAGAAVNTTDQVDGWLTFLWTSIRTCTFESEIDGSMKRFSIAEAALIAAGIGGALGLMIGVPLVGTGVLLAGTVVGFSLVTAALGTLWIAYDYSSHCVPAAPYQLADDVFYAATHTVLTPCEYFWAGGVINEASYDNDNCKPCANIGSWTYASCYHEVGFADLGYNIAFYLTQYFPTLVDTLNGTRIPILADLIAFDFVQVRLHAWDDYDASDPVQFSQHWSCAMQHTLVPNLLIAMAVLALFALLAPIIGLLGKLLLGLLYPAALALLATFSGMMLLFSVSSVVTRPPPPRPPPRLEGLAAGQWLHARVDQGLQRLRRGAAQRPRRAVAMQAVIHA
jgi:hypothetical protein